MSEDDFGFKKVCGMIPRELYGEMQARGIFDDSFDGWLTKAIRELLSKENKNSGVD